ncbi:MAG: rhomboid family intramembrane serine protease [Candidatus Aenigmarchaeota archaeon]|nr:rhomboid family intramembrane serine protease [Candidatus Aenigmarchaeota archaeon]MDW8159856.1 rhomboid family intramembrane serine protease [Candidatus Aenigmarchaeota archaeon]
MMVFIFFLQNIPGFFESLSFIPSQALAKPWMFITSIFLHADYIHLFYNMFALFFFGTYLENIVGVKNYIKIFLISGLAGNILFFFTTHDPKIPAVGASGAIFGIIGALTALRPYEIIYFFFIPMPLVVAAFLWAIGSLIGMLFPSSIAHSAHLAGLIAGFLYARWLKKIYSKKYTRRIIWY